MASVNKVILLGNLGNEPDVRYTADGSRAIATLSVATSRRYKSQDGQLVSETEWHRVVLFGRSAELARDYLHKGNPIYVEGRLRTRKWTDANGVDRYSTEIIGETMQFVGGRNQNEGGAPVPPPVEGFETGPRPSAQRPVPPRQSAPAAAPAAPAASIDELEEDVPF